MEDEIPYESFVDYLPEAGLPSIQNALKKGYESDHARVYAKIPTKSFGEFKVYSHNMFGGDQGDIDLPYTPAKYNPNIDFPSRTEKDHNNLIRSVVVAAETLAPDFILLQEMSTSMPEQKTEDPKEKITRDVVWALGANEFQLAKSERENPAAALHIVSSMPNPEELRIDPKYKNSYIFIQKESELKYITFDEILQILKVDDIPILLPNKFQQTLSKINPQKKRYLRLSEEQVNELIIQNVTNPPHANFNIGSHDSMTFYNAAKFYWEQTRNISFLPNNNPLKAQITLLTNNAGKHLCIWNVHADFSVFPDVTENYLRTGLEGFEQWCQNNRINPNDVEHVFGGDFNGDFAHVDEANCFINCTNVATTQGDGKQIYKSPDGFFYVIRNKEGEYEFTQPPIQIIHSRTGEVVDSKPMFLDGFPFEQQHILIEYHPVLALDEKWRTAKVVAGKTIFEYEAYLRSALNCDQIIVRPAMDYYGERAISIGFKQVALNTQNPAKKSENRQVEKIFDLACKIMGVRDGSPAQQAQYNKLSGGTITDSLLTLSVPLQAIELLERSMPKVIQLWRQANDEKRKIVVPELKAIYDNNYNKNHSTHLHLLDDLTEAQTQMFCESCSGHALVESLEKIFLQPAWANFTYKISGGDEKSGEVTVVLLSKASDIEIGTVKFSFSEEGTVTCSNLVITHLLRQSFLPRTSSSPRLSLSEAELNFARTLEEFKARISQLESERPLFIVPPQHLLSKKGVFFESNYINEASFSPAATKQQKCIAVISELIERLENYYDPQQKNKEDELNNRIQVINNLSDILTELHSDREPTQTQINSLRPAATHLSDAGSETARKAGFGIAVGSTFIFIPSLVLYILAFGVLASAIANPLFLFIPLGIGLIGILAGSRLNRVNQPGQITSWLSSLADMLEKPADGLKKSPERPEELGEVSESSTLSTEPPPTGAKRQEPTSPETKSSKVFKPEDKLAGKLEDTPRPITKDV